MYWRKFRLQALLLEKQPKLQKRELKQNKLKPKLQRVMPRPKLGLQSPPRRNPWKPKKRKEKLQNRFCLNKLPLLLSKHLPKFSIILYDMLLKKKSEKLNSMPKN
jgi:hypothetical protein